MAAGRSRCRIDSSAPAVMLPAGTEWSSGRRCRPGRAAAAAAARLAGGRSLVGDQSEREGVGAPPCFEVNNGPSPRGQTAEVDAGVRPCSYKRQPQKKVSTLEFFFRNNSPLVLVLCED